MILLTGASGFVGQHLLKGLCREYGVENVVALTSKPIDGHKYLLHNNYSFEKDFFEKEGYSQIHTIIHGGAFTPKSQDDSNNWNGCLSNITSSTSLLEASFPVLKKIINLSTLDVYENAEVLDEQSRVVPISLYGHSKFFVEGLVKSFAYNKSIDHQILRLGHVYGPGEEKYKKIIPLTMAKLARNERPSIWGSGEEKRSFIFVDDAICAIINSVKSNKSVGVVNIVSGQSISIKDLVYKIIALSGKNILPEIVPTSTVQRNYFFDNSKLLASLLSIETGLEKGLEREWQFMEGKLR